MQKIIAFFLALAFIEASASTHKHLAALPRHNNPIRDIAIANQLLARQACAADQVTCGFDCLVAGSDCCVGGSTHIEYCNPGTFCWGTANACCHPGDVACGLSCMPPGSACCSNDGKYCSAGDYCVGDANGFQGCCPEGQTCSGPSTTYAAGETITGPSAAASTTPPSTVSATTTPSAGPVTTTPTTSIPVAPSSSSAVPNTFTGLAVHTPAPLGAELPAVIAIIAGQILL